MKSKRVAISTFFFVNGFLYANWIARLPELQAFFGLSNTGLGSLLLVIAAGAIVAMPLSGWLSTRLGTRNITKYSALLFCVAIPCITLSPQAGVAAIFFLIIGFTAGAMDVAMNGQAIVLERDWGKPIMSSFHAIFSIGTALGAGSGALFAKFDFSLPVHFSIGAGFGVIATFIASFYLIYDQPEKEEGAESKKVGFTWPTKAILPLGIIGFCGMTGEGAMADWSAIFMNKVVGQSEAFSALAFASFATAMTVGRIFGDYFTHLLGKDRLLLIDCFLAIIGLTMVIVFASVWSTFVGLFLVGLGIATVVPIVYSTAGNTPGVAPSVGIAMATAVSYTGFFVGPPTIGFLSDLYGLRLGLGFALFLFVVMLVFVLRRQTYS